jgi:hypothetical protein
MVTVLVASDLAPDRFVQVTKNPTELPSKFYVEYVNDVKGDYPGAGRDPTSAVRFDSRDDYEKKLNPKSVNLVDPVSVSGFTPSAPPGQVLFFIVESKAG